MVTISIKEAKDGDQPHQYEYRLDGANREWLPFDYGDPDGDITLAALVARQRDQLQVANYELQVENEHLRERLANYEKPPGKGSSSIPIQSEVDDYQITTTVKSVSHKPSFRGVGEAVS